jgi:hypothetical protein
MLTWVEPAMQALMRGLAFIMQLVGLLGLIVFSCALFNRMIDRLIEEDGNENQFCQGCEDQHLQPRFRCDAE